MKKSMIIAGAMMVLGASIASAQGEINLAWTDCNASGTPMTTFACNSNTGLNSLVGSFVAPGTLPEFLGISVDMNFQFTGSPGIPLWWQHGAGTCRGTTGMATNFDFTANFNCLDFYVGSAAGGFAYDMGYGAPNRSRLRIQLAVPFENRGQISDADGEYYAFKVNLLRSKTTGTGSCEGCATPVNIVLDEIQLFQPPEQANDPRIITPGATNATAGWQTGPTPVKNATWGQVKSLYR
jgi:hypothetical protein